MPAKNVPSTSRRRGVGPFVAACGTEFGTNPKNSIRLFPADDKEENVHFWPVVVALNGCDAVIILALPFGTACGRRRAAIGRCGRAAMTTLLIGSGWVAKKVSQKGIKFNWNRRDWTCAGSPFNQLATIGPQPKSTEASSFLET